MSFCVRKIKSTSFEFTMNIRVRTYTIAMDIITAFRILKFTIVQ